VVQDETHCLDLSIGFERIVKAGTKEHARAARKARRAGVSVRLAESENDWRAYFQAYVSSHARWGALATRFYPWKFFAVLFKRRSPNIRLWLAIHENEIVAGAICLYSPRTVVYWHGAALASHFALRPVNLLLHEIIKDASEHGFRWFDFNPSGGLEGVKNFKKSFGATALASDVLQMTSPAVAAISNCRSLLGKYFPQIQ
jgi:predicted N-acyltransferase